MFQLILSNGNDAMVYFNVIARFRIKGARVRSRVSLTEGELGSLL